MSLARKKGDTWERQDALSKMDLVRVVRAYVDTMLDEVPGYKALLVDKETVKFISLVYTQTELGTRNVFCTERLDANTGQYHSELKAICFLRPTRENVTNMKRELRTPRFQSFSLYFTNVVQETFLNDIAEQDAVRELVDNVQEFYADYLVMDPHHFAVPVQKPEVLTNTKLSLLDGHRTPTSELDAVDRLTQGVSAIFQSLRRKPAIRYQSGSELATRLAINLYNLVYSYERTHFDFGVRGGETPSVLLIVDRRDDPVTPLLTQWTYQAMAHELVHVEDNKLNLSKHRNVPKDFHEVVFSALHDDFFKQHMYSNYGDLALAVKSLVESFEGEASSNQNIKTIEDMQRFVMQYSDYSQKQRNVSKHVNIMSVVSGIVANRSLMDFSEVEQELAYSPNASASGTQDAIIKLLQNPSASSTDKLRLVMLYALRFESDKERIRQLTYRLSLEGVDDQLIQVVNQLIKYAGASRRKGDLYGNRSVFSRAKKMVKAIQGVENVYTQHTPLLTETIRLLSTNDLPHQSYPYASEVGEELAHWQAQFKKSPPKDIIIFIVGGTTYEEAKAVAELNERSDSNVRVLLGGSGVVNSASFISAIRNSVPTA